MSSSPKTFATTPSLSEFFGSLCNFAYFSIFCDARSFLLGKVKSSVSKIEFLAISTYAFGSLSESVSMEKLA